MPTRIEEIVNYAAAAAALVAAALWWSASRVQYPQATVIEGGVEGGLSQRDQHSLIDALEQCGKLNKWAALASSAAAFLTALGILLGPT